MMQPPGREPPYAYIEANTYAWLAKVATVVPIPPTISAPEAAAYFEHVHGLYLHEGWADQPAYADLVRMFIAMATAAAAAGDYFPIWGTCQGFQRLMQAAGGKLERFDALGFTTGSRFNMYGDVGASRLLGHATKAQLARLHTHVPYFNHEWGISLQHFKKSHLHKKFRILATAHDRAGKEYIALVEGLDLPFYGVQSHPEMASDLEWMAAFFVTEMRKSRHTGFCPDRVRLQPGDCEEAGAMIPCFRLDTTKTVSRP